MPPRSPAVRLAGSVVASLLLASSPLLGGPLAGCAAGPGAPTSTAGAGSPGSPSAPTDAAPSPATAAPSQATAAQQPAGKRIEVRVDGGRVQPAPGRVSVRTGERVTLVVTADRADEVHVHGYDVSARVAPGRPATVSLRASSPGLFEVELEEAHLQLLQLVVR